MSRRSVTVRAEEAPAPTRTSTRHIGLRVAGLMGSAAATAAHRRALTADADGDGDGDRTSTGSPRASFTDVTAATDGLRPRSSVDMAGTLMSLCDPAAALAAGAQAPVAVIDAQHSAADPAVAIRHVRSASPSTRCVVVTAGGTDEQGRLLEAGAMMTVDAGRRLSCLLWAISAARDGRPTMDDVTRQGLLRAWYARRAWERHRDTVRVRLTPREMEVLAALADGHAHNDIAAALGISPATVRTHIRNLLSKLGASSRLQAVAVALRLGVIVPPGSRRSV